MKRNLTIDYVKFFACILMVFGHCITMGRGLAFFESGKGISEFSHHYIYSFHMPLFAMCSGYFFYKTVAKRTFLETAVNRMQRILIPIFTWQVIINIHNAIYQYFMKGTFSLYTLIIPILKIYTNHWFLWAMLVCSFVVALIYYFAKDCDTIYCIVIFLTMLPNFGNRYNLYVWLLPFFFISFWYAKNENKLEFLKKYFKNWGVILFLGIAHYILIYLWKTDYYIYDYGNGYAIINNGIVWYSLFVNLYRIAAGLIGSVFWVCVLNKISAKISEKCFISRIVCIVSKYSLIVYIVSVNILNTYLRLFSKPYFGYFEMLVETILITAISCAIAHILNRNNFTKKVFLGGR